MTRKRGVLETVKAYAKQRVRNSLFSLTDTTGFEELFGAGTGSNQVNYAAEIGDGHYSDIAMASVKWLMRVFPEPPFLVEKRNNDDEWESIPEHPLVERLENPNEGYDGDLLLVATELSFALSGNAYWWIIPSRGGGVAEIWWLPPPTCGA